LIPGYLRRLGKKPVFEDDLVAAPPLCDLVVKKILAGTYVSPIAVHLLDPTQGREQAGLRPVLILSNGRDFKEGFGCGSAALSLCGFA
jgi:hypothetical protein